MNSKTEELLYLLFWGFDMFSRPTLFKLTESYESWAYRNGFLRQFKYLKKARLVESQPGANNHASFRLSELARRNILGGKDPEREWDRPWDGHWRWVVFDVPENQRKNRRQLRELLHDQGFGCLQRSVWISPHPLDHLRASLAKFGLSLKTLIAIEGRPNLDATDAAIVVAAWDFTEINRRYENCLRILADCPGRRNLDAAMRNWYRKEQVAWLDAVFSDPLLPRALLPEDYLGTKVWEKRKATWARI